MRGLREPSWVMAYFARRISTLSPCDPRLISVRSVVQIYPGPLKRIVAPLGLLVGRGFPVLAHSVVHSRFPFAVGVNLGLLSERVREAHGLPKIVRRDLIVDLPQRPVVGPDELFLNLR